MAKVSRYTEEFNEEIIFIHKQYPKLSQTKIAKRLDCSQPYVSRVLNNYYEKKHEQEHPTPWTVVGSIETKMRLLSDHLDKLSTHPVEPYTTRAIAYATKVYVDNAKELQAYQEEKKVSWKTFWNTLVNESLDLYRIIWLVIERAREGGLIEKWKQVPGRLTPGHKATGINTRKEFIDDLFAEHDRIEAEAKVKRDFEYQEKVRKQQEEMAERWKDTDTTG